MMMRAAEKKIIKIDSSLEKLFAIYSKKYQALKKKSWENFEKKGLPTRKNTDWKYTNLSFLSQKKITFFQKNTEKEKTLFLKDCEKVNLPESCKKIFILNSDFLKEESCTDCEKGLEIKSLNELPSLHLEELEKKSSYLNDDFDDLNKALFCDGLFLRVAQNTNLQKALCLFFKVDQEKKETETLQASFFRGHLHLEKNAQARVYIHFSSKSFKNSADEILFLRNLQSSITLCEGARLELFLIQEEGKQVAHISTFKTFQKKDSHFSCFILSAGSALAKISLSSLQQGENTTTKLHGLALAQGKQHQSLQTKIWHSASHSQSKQDFKAIAQEESSCVFNGAIVIKEKIEKIKAEQLSKSLLLSTKAQAYAKPELQINSDDVRCQHGASIGPLRKEELFYLESRGLSKKKAESLLAQAFIEGIFSFFQDKKIKKYFASLSQKAFKLQQSTEEEVAQR